MKQNRRSNTNTVGLWAFRIGKTRDSIEEPDLVVGLGIQINILLFCFNLILQRQTNPVFKAFYYVDDLCRFVLDEVAETGASCSIGATECHSQAQCIDYSPGYCCQCITGFFGNGRVCLQESKLYVLINKFLIFNFTLANFFLQQFHRESQGKLKAY